jgi:eukaryotic-like serine/threonine-protein kinase
MNSRSIVNFFQVASLLMVLVVVGLLAAIATMHFAIHGAEVQVPALKAMTVADALSETAGLGLKLDVDNRYYSADVAQGHILTQSPAAGTVVRREWKVRVSESLGPQMVDVPDTVGRDERVAELELRRAGLAVRATATLPYANVPEGTVLAQDPPAHAQDIAQPSVSLLVATASDEAPDGYVMPDLVGLPVVTAQSALTKVGIKSATPRYVDVAIAPIGTGSALPVPPIRPGAITAQSPPAGARVEQSTIIHLTVAK